MIVPIGSLVIININFRFSRHERIDEGDYGIVIGYPTSRSEYIFDYVVESNGITVFLFKHEVTLVT